MGELWALGALAFAAATILPFSSEAAVLAALARGHPPASVLLIASLGNCLGALTNVGLGRWLAPRVRPRLEASAAGRRALRWADRWGGWCLAGSWLPIVGDPLLLAAGMLRLRWIAIIVLGLGTRIARYAVITLTWG